MHGKCSDEDSLSQWRIWASPLNSGFGLKNSKHIFLRVAFGAIIFSDMRPCDRRFQQGWGLLSETGHDQKATLLLIVSQDLEVAVFGWDYRNGTNPRQSVGGVCGWNRDQRRVLGWAGGTQ